MTPLQKKELLEEIRVLQIYPGIKVVLNKIVGYMGEPLPAGAIEVAKADDHMLEGMFKDKEDNA